MNISFNSRNISAVKTFNTQQLVWCDSNPYVYDSVLDEWVICWQKAIEPYYIYTPGNSTLIKNVTKGTGVGYNDDKIELLSNCIRGFDNWSGMSQQINFIRNIETKGYTKLNFDLEVQYSKYLDATHGISISISGDLFISHNGAFINNYPRSIYTMNIPSSYISQIHIGGDMYPGGWWYIYNMWMS